MEGKLNGKSVLDENGAGEKVDDYLSDAFPAGLRILIIDDDKEYLTLLENMLKRCQYEVTKCERAMEALYLLREDRNRFDIVICDLHMPEIDGFKLLEIASLEMDLPVIIMSGDDEKEVILKGIIHGACDYWVKPVRLETIRVIWQHVVRKRRKSSLKETQQPVGCKGDAVVQPKISDQGEPMSLRNKGDIKLYKKRKDDQEDEAEPSDGVTYNTKKQRMVWTCELHQKFVAAVNQLGHDRAVPKKILECMQSMGITDVTRENIASHLQKYRLYMQKMKPGAVDETTRDCKAIQSKKSIFQQTPSSNLWNIQSYGFSHQLLQSNGLKLPTEGSIFRHQLIERGRIQQQAIESQIAYATTSFGLSLDDQGSVLQPRTAEPYCNPITELHMHDFDLENHVYGVNAAVEISSLGDGCLYKNTTPFVANELVIPDPSALTKQFDQADFFRGPFA